MSSNISQSQQNLENSSKIFRWNYILMTAIGHWPLNPNNFLYAINFGYFSYFLALEYLDLFLFIDNLEHVLLNLTENMAFTQIFTRMLMLRLYNKELGVIISDIYEDFNPKNYTEEEIEILIPYYTKSKRFMRLLIINTAFTATSFYMKPFLGQMNEILEYASPQNVNNTRNFDFILPYQFYTFYELKDASTYFWTYGSQFPFVFVSGFGQCSADCLMVSLVYHVSGQMAVLASRISNINTEPTKCTQNLHQVVKSHIRLLRMGAVIEDAFSVILLTHILCATALVCILGYQILTCLSNGDNAVLISFFAFIFLVLLILYCLCQIGENLITESNRVCEAFYDCKWYNMSKSNAYVVIISIARAQKPLRLTAGQFSTFCLETFTNSLKTSMGYLSVLRTVMISDE